MGKKYIGIANEERLSQVFTLFVKAFSPERYPAQDA